MCTKLFEKVGSLSFTKDEAYEMYQHAGTIDATTIAKGGTAFITTIGYWTSSEYNSSVAWTQGMPTGSQGLATKNNLNYRVRAIRSF